nr:putative ORF1 [Marmot picobirnavirus]AVX53823.1 putative ORF1 [Marmot picobirnavirus]AVX53828.1 putative ORF1 [Marmot picobirnavirus]
MKGQTTQSKVAMTLKSYTLSNGALCDYRTYTHHNFLSARAQASHDRKTYAELGFLTSVSYTEDRIMLSYIVPNPSSPTLPPVVVGQSVYVWKVCPYSSIKGKVYGKYYDTNLGKEEN